MSYNLSCPTVSLAFPEGTVEDKFTFSVTGTLADGSGVTNSETSADSSALMDLAPGTYTLVVSKNGVSSLPSDPFTVAVPVTVMLTVPDADQKAVISG